MEQFLSLLHDPDLWKINHMTCSTCCGFGMTVRNKCLVLLWGDLTSFLRPDYYFFFLAVWALSLCLAGLVASKLVGSLVPCTRDRTHTSCIGRRILNHWTAREVPLRPLHEQSCGSFCFGSLQLESLRRFILSTPESVTCISELNCLKSRWTDVTEKIEQSSLQAN